MGSLTGISNGQPGRHLQFISCAVPLTQVFFNMCRAVAAS